MVLPKNQSLQTKAAGARADADDGFPLIFCSVPFQTAFVRQKTPHPKELKAKAHKLFGSRDRSNASANAAAADGDTTGGETSGANGIDPTASAAAANGIGNGSANHVGGDEDNNEESEEVSVINEHHRDRLNNGP